MTYHLKSLLKSENFISLIFSYFYSVLICGLYISQLLCQVLVTAL